MAYNDENNEEFYRCSCGFKTDDLSEFRRHMLLGKAEPGTHKSLGTKPANPKGVTPKGSRKMEADTKDSKRAERGAKALPTSSAGNAQTITVVPRTFTMSSRIFWDAYKAVTETWPGWQGMSEEEFLDNYLQLTLYQRGIYVGGYVVFNKPEEIEEVKHAVLQDKGREGAVSS